MVRRVSSAITTHLGPLYIKLPLTEESVKVKVTNFYSKFSVPQCIGVIDGTHTEIRQPLISDYINRKSRGVQALCYYRCCFMDAVGKWPGSVNVSRIFANSSLNSMLKNGIIPPCYTKIMDEEVPIFIVGDPAYSLMMKEYAGGGTSCQEQYFGYKLCSARNVIECSFGRLKARFGILKWAMDINMDDLPNVI